MQVCLVTLSSGNFEFVRSQLEFLSRAHLNKEILDHPLSLPESTFLAISGCAKVIHTGLPRNSIFWRFWISSFAAGIFIFCSIEQGNSWPRRVLSPSSKNQKWYFQPPVFLERSSFSGHAPVNFSTIYSSDLRSGKLLTIIFPSVGSERSYYGIFTYFHLDTTTAMTSKSADFDIVSCRTKWRMDVRVCGRENGARGPRTEFMYLTPDRT